MFLAILEAMVAALSVSFAVYFAFQYDVLWASIEFGVATFFALLSIMSIICATREE